MGEAVGKLIGYIPEILKNFATTLWDVGKNIVVGIWEGITGNWEWFTGKLHEFFQGIVDGAKEALGIASPSKEFAAIGENAAGSFIGSLGDKLEGLKGGPLGMMLELGKGVGEWVSQGLTNSLALVQQAAAGIADMIRNGISQALQGVQAELMQLVTVFEAAAQKMPRLLQAAFGMIPAMMEQANVAIRETTQELTAMMTVMDAAAQRMQGLTAATVQAGNTISNIENNFFNFVQNVQGPAAGNAALDLRYAAILAGVH
jgi:phage-related protein